MAGTVQRPGPPGDRAGPRVPCRSPGTGHAGQEHTPAIRPPRAVR